MGLLGRQQCSGYQRQYFRRRLCKIKKPHMESVHTVVEEQTLRSEHQFNVNRISKQRVDCVNKGNIRFE